VETVDALGQHTSSQFNAELERVRGDVLAMGGVVERQLARAVLALTQPQAQMAAAVSLDERVINEHERMVDEECSRILAIRAPAARDLRMVVAIMKAVTDLERIGDEAQKMAGIAASVDSSRQSTGQFRRLKNLGDLALEMLRDALDSLARLDAAKAFQVIQRDRQVDEEYETLQRQAVTLMLEEPRTIRRTLDIMWVVRSMERAGDHAKNICEHVLYAVLGKDVRHVQLEEIRKVLHSEKLETMRS
jgi:phosphate transport system protein